ncbi:inositol monophosphatase family protein [Micromonosporaceae bacterium Da 78-11]
METDLQLAQRAAMVGASVALPHFAALADLPRELKADGTVVTAADRAVESAIRAVLNAARPDDAILGEEHGHITGSGSRRWIIDPIDGTALFVAGDDRWLILIALEEDGEIVTGVAAHPAQGSIWWATRGGGAFEGRVVGGRVVAETRIRVADRPRVVLDGRPASDGPAAIASAHTGSPAIGTAAVDPAASEAPAISPAAIGGAAIGPIAVDPAVVDSAVAGTAGVGPLALGAGAVGSAGAGSLALGPRVVDSVVVGSSADSSAGAELAAVESVGVERVGAEQARAEQVGTHQAGAVQVEAERVGAVQVGTEQAGAGQVGAELAAVELAGAALAGGGSGLVAAGSAVAGRGVVAAGEVREARLGVVPVDWGHELVAAVKELTPSRPWTVHPALHVARGELDLALQTGGQIWDFAATSLIVTEAGGRYSGLDGRPQPGPGASVYARDESLRQATLDVLAGAET